MRGFRAVCLLEMEGKVEWGMGIEFRSSVCRVKVQDMQV